MLPSFAHKGCFMLNLWLGREECQQHLRNTTEIVCRTFDQNNELIYLLGVCWSHLLILCVNFCATKTLICLSFVLYHHTGFSFLIMCLCGGIVKLKSLRYLILQKFLHFPVI